MSIRFASVCALALVVSACGSSTPAAPAPDVWAVVNGAEIKRDRVERYYRSMVASSQTTPSEEEAVGAKLGLIDELITDELVIARATELKIVPTTEEIEKGITERRGSLSDADFKSQLEARKTSLDEFRAEVTREVTKAKVI